MPLAQVASATPVALGPLNPGAEITIEAWAQPPAAPTGETLLRSEDEQVQLAWTDGAWLARIGATELRAPSAGEGPIHLAVTADARVVRLYVNGTLAGQSPREGAALEPGAWVLDHPDAVDEVRVWSTVRDAASIVCTQSWRLTGREPWLYTRHAGAVALVPLQASQGNDIACVDFDRDGFAGDVDCDDFESAHHPGAPEVAANDVDENCDGRDGDVDGDGFDAPKDCDDANATVYPGAPDTPYDGVVHDCNRVRDFDFDQDGHDSAAHGGDDCNDADPSVRPGATDVWYDGIDHNCDGANDFDADGDGIAAVAGGGADCDDTNPHAFPGAPEVWYDGVDQDCDGGDDHDQDRDGHTQDADCDDLNPEIHPGAEEVWYDGVDQNCDGASDFDADGDGHDRGADCDDTRAETWPGAPELADGLDNNCNGVTETADTDGDGITDEIEIIAGTGPRDLDSDGDGLLDSEEWPQPGPPIDTDQDGRVDAADDDDDDDGIPTRRELRGGDSDGDGIFDHLDLDSDNDGISDTVEGTRDSDCDGIGDWIDPTDDDGDCTAANDEPATDTEPQVVVELVPTATHTASSCDTLGQLPLATAMMLPLIVLGIRR